MSNLLIASAASIWFALFFAGVMAARTVARAPENAPWAVPFALNVAFTFSRLVFDVPREDGAAVLQEGLSASNIMTLAITVAAGLYLAYRVATRRSVIALPFAVDYRPYTLMVLWNLLSASWSIVPAYTLYRSAEFIIYYVLTLLIFDRTDVRRKLGPLLALYVSVWLALALPGIVTNLASGIIFSSAKNNTIPLACSALMLMATLDRTLAHRGALFALGLAGFVVAGSASSAGALVWAIPPAWLIASDRRGVRIAGAVLGLAVLSAFAFLIVGLSAFPELVDILSVLLQKPPVELEHATGRADFWPIFIIATRDHMLGSGFSAADRFIQFLVPPGAFPDTYARDQIHFGNSHNMFLSAWAGTGVVGLAFAAAVLGSAMRRASRLPPGGRRLVIALVAMLILNGLTTPGIFQDWGPMNFVFVALIGYTRIEALRAGRGRVDVAASPIRAAAIPPHGAVAGEA